jgi:autophagy-related protein 27
MLRCERIAWFNIASILLLAWAQLVDADDTFRCKVGTEAGIFDLTSLKDEHTLNITRDTPPSRIIDSVKINLCNDIQKQEHLKETDQVRLFSVCLGLV